MSKMESVKQKMANVIVKTAVGTAEKTVGRSFPWGTHEVKVPDKVREYVVGKMNKE